MLVQNWDTIVNALVYSGVAGVLLYYIKPDLFTPVDPQRPGPLVYLVGIYILIWILVLILWYLYYKPEFATVKGLWSITPTGEGASYYDAGKMVAGKEKVDLLSETQVANFFGETFTFSFFVSVDNGGIDTVKGDSLQSGKPYQNLLVIPGAFNVSIDPLHETMRLNFLTYGSKSEEVLIPTLSVRRWHQILVSVEGRTADIYQNGLLLKSVPLPNVIGGSPGKPQVYMNSDMYARLAYVQAWPRRILEKEVANNYRSNISDQNVPPLPSTTMGAFGIPKFNFCLGGMCIDSTKPQASGLTHVEYTYA
jgi:hypothetical protein